MAGAPRTTMALMASAISLAVRTGTQASSRGSRLWSRSQKTPSSSSKRKGRIRSTP